MEEKYRNLGRIFSVEFRKRQVDLYDRGVLSIREICELHDVSDSGVRKWIKKYSRHKRDRTRVVIELESEGKKNQALRARIAELEAALGRKQMELDYLNKLVDVNSEELGVDLRKKGALPHLSGSGSTKGNTPGK